MVELVEDMGAFIYISKLLTEVQRESHKTAEVVNGSFFQRRRNKICNRIWQEPRLKPVKQ